MSLLLSIFFFFLTLFLSAASRGISRMSHLKSDRSSFLVFLRYSFILPLLLPTLSIFFYISFIPSFSPFFYFWHFVLFCIFFVSFHDFILEDPHITSWTQTTKRIFGINFSSLKEETFSSLCRNGVTLKSSNSSFRLLCWRCLVAAFKILLLKLVSQLLKADEQVST